MGGVTALAVYRVAITATNRTIPIPDMRTMAMEFLIWFPSTWYNVFCLPDYQLAISLKKYFEAARMCFQNTTNDHTNCEIIWRQYVKVLTRNMRYLGGNVNNSYPGLWPVGITSQIAKFMGPTWGPPGSCRPQMGPMLAPWTLLSGLSRTPHHVMYAHSLRFSRFI